MLRAHWASRWILERAGRVSPVVDDRPFLGSEAVRSGRTTWGRLNGPSVRRLGIDVFVRADVPDSPLLAIRAAVVRAGPDAVVTGWSACIALGLDVAPGPRPVELTSVEQHLRGTKGAVTRRQAIPPEEIEVRDGLRVTSPIRTAFDLATRTGPAARPPESPADVVAAADALARLGRFDGERLMAFAREHPGLRGVRRVPMVAALLEPLAESPPESRLRVKLVAAGLPRPVAQFPVRTERWSPRRRLDLAWPDHKVAVEYDGKDHAQEDRRWRDLDRLDELRRGGWIVIVVTAHQAGRPTWVADRVREALCSRGWVPAAPSVLGT